MHWIAEILQVPNHHTMLICS